MGALNKALETLAANIRHHEAEAAREGGLGVNMITYANREAHTELKAHIDNGGWMPIESAPEVGGYVLGYVWQDKVGAPHADKSGNPFKERAIKRVYYIHDVKLWSIIGEKERPDITHWQHLPPAPNKETTQC